MCTSLIAPTISSVSASAGSANAARFSSSCESDVPPMMTAPVHRRRCEWTRLRGGGCATDDDGAVRRDEGPRPAPEDRQLGRRDPRPLCNRAVRVRRLQRLLPRVAGVPARHVIAKGDEARAAPGRGGRALPVPEARDSSR